MYTRLSAPLDVQWELTPWCTYNCVHCYNYWRRDERPMRVLTEDQLVVRRKTAKELLENKVFHVTLTGGEPLGVIEQVMPELRQLASAGIQMSINTNLALMTTEMGKLLKELGIRSILTSLMSADEILNDEIAQQRGAFRRTIEGIKVAVSMGLRVSVNMVVSQKNFDTIYDTGKLAYSLGAKAFCATKVSKPSNCEDFTGFPLSREQLGSMFHELIRIRKAFGIEVASLEHYPACVFPNTETRTMFGNRNCSAAKTSCTIGFDGNIRPCSHAPMSYGNVAEQGLSVAWIGMDAWRDDSLVPSVCKLTCGEYPGKCGGGCRIESLNVHQGVGGSDPYSLEAAPAAKRAVAKLKLLDPAVIVQLQPKVRFRKENFGFIAYRSSTNWVAMDSTLYGIVVPSKPVSVTDVATAYQSSEDDALETLSILSAKGIVQII
ncbi:MAG: Radical SAM domain protein [candidate division WWE3 bacterium GW2011_GWF1_42_14]|uniref:Radical SAM domain protein n=2 Tax=Katanobacteria TaxID=422282 RepID=A0A0G1BP23_UNCKA|nr:MAG: Radical SAM domain protein [candidate division WWE3 bacterium GW2011_GWA1_42_12]KKS33655.1 MAG: Radical SAM domain protein [candidate division WWE3 bacterium GW2011_GWD1_42_14]KKS39223.1 MAG: Radical SAM domain protein [candidate division WWE3 bacterium GW2011_GWF1_42_14]KKS40721.1 MAG: Radical SAM domain protein [candidate division WWE3 bacterium GW2011_GWE1_42_16]